MSDHTQPRPALCEHDYSEVTETIGSGMRTRHKDSRCRSRRRESVEEDGLVVGAADMPQHPKTALFGG